MPLQPPVNGDCWGLGLKKHDYNSRKQICGKHGRMRLLKLPSVRGKERNTRTATQIWDESHLILRVLEDKSNKRNECTCKHRCFWPKFCHFFHCEHKYESSIRQTTWNKPTETDIAVCRAFFTSNISGAWRYEIDDVLVLFSSNGKWGSLWEDATNTLPRSTPISSRRNRPGQKWPLWSFSLKYYS